MIDFATALAAPNGNVLLNGDPEHAGVQYRPANEVAPEETVYVFPKENADPRQDLGRSDEGGTSSQDATRLRQYPLSQ